MSQTLSDSLDDIYTSLTDINIIRVNATEALYKINRHSSSMKAVTATLKQILILLQSFVSTIDSDIVFPDLNTEIENYNVTWITQASTITSNALTQSISGDNIIVLGDIAESIDGYINYINNQLASVQKQINRAQKQINNTFITQVASGYSYTDCRGEIILATLENIQDIVSKPINSQYTDYQLIQGWNSSHAISPYEVVAPEMDTIPFINLNKGCNSCVSDAYPRTCHWKYRRIKFIKIRGGKIRTSSIKIPLYPRKCSNELFADTFNLPSYNLFTLPSVQMDISSTGIVSSGHIKAALFYSTDNADVNSNVSNAVGDGILSKLTSTTPINLLNDEDFVNMLKTNMKTNEALTPDDAIVINSALYRYLKISGIEISELVYSCVSIAAFNISIGGTNIIDVPFIPLIYVPTINILKNPETDEDLEPIVLRPISGHMPLEYTIYTKIIVGIIGLVQFITELINDPYGMFSTAVTSPLTLTNLVNQIQLKLLRAFIEIVGAEEVYNLLHTLDLLITMKITIGYCDCDCSNTYPLYFKATTYISCKPYRAIVNVLSITEELARITALAFGVLEEMGGRENVILAPLYTEVESFLSDVIEPALQTEKDNVEESFGGYTFTKFYEYKTPIPVSFAGGLDIFSIATNPQAAITDLVSKNTKKSTSISTSEQL